MLWLNQGLTGVLIYQERADWTLLLFYSKILQISSTVGNITAPLELSAPRRWWHYLWQEENTFVFYQTFTVSTTIKELRTSLKTTSVWEITDHSVSSHHPPTQYKANWRYIQYVQCSKCHSTVGRIETHIRKVNVLDGFICRKERLPHINIT